MSLANQAALLASFAAIPGFEDWAAQQRALDERATYLQRRRPLSREDALAVALFSRGTWAQRYPIRPHDLGEEAALFVADWLMSRHVEPTPENMDAALQEWQAHKMAHVEHLQELADIRAIAAKIAAKQKAQDEAAVELRREMVCPTEDARNRFERRRAASRRRKQ